MDGKSIMGILLLAAACGSSITISAEGPDERAAVDALVALVQSGFGEDAVVRRLIGIGVSPGVVAGRAVILIQRDAGASLSDPAGARGARARAAGRQPGARHGSSCRTFARASARQRGPELASLFDAQLLMLDDPMLIPRTVQIVREQRVNAEWALQQVFQEFGALFDEVADSYLRERRGDVADLVGRLRMNLRHGLDSPRDLLRELDESSVLIADELTPSLAAQVDWTKVRGFATDAGSRTYHTAILARSLDVPAVVGLHNASRLVEAGQWVVIDGSDNALIVDPDRGGPRARGAARRRSASGGRRRRPSGAGRRRPPTGRTCASTRTSSFRTIWPRRATPEPRASASIGRSSCCRAPRATWPTRIGNTRSIGTWSKAWRRGVVTIRTFDVDEHQLASLCHRPRPRRRLGERGPRQSSGTARPAAEPVAPRRVSGADPRAAAGGAVRLPAHHVPVRVGRRTGSRGTADRRRDGGGPGAAGRRRCRACRSAS